MRVLKIRTIVGASVYEFEAICQEYLASRVRRMLPTFSSELDAGLNTSPLQGCPQRMQRRTMTKRTNACIRRWIKLSPRCQIQNVGCLISEDLNARKACNRPQLRSIQTGWLARAPTGLLSRSSHAVGRVSGRGSLVGCEDGESSSSPQLRRASRLRRA